MIILPALPVPGVKGVLSTGLPLIALAQDGGLSAQLDSTASSGDGVDIYGGVISNATSTDQLQILGSLRIPSFGDGRRPTFSALVPMFPYLYAVRTSIGTPGPIGLIVSGQNTTAPSGSVSGVTGTPPIFSSGGPTPDITIAPATDLAPGSLSAADKTKLDTQVVLQGGNTFAPAAPLQIGNNTPTQPASLGVPATGVQSAFVKLDPNGGAPVATLATAAGGTTHVGTIDGTTNVSGGAGPVNIGVTSGGGDCDVNIITNGQNLTVTGTTTSIQSTNTAIGPSIPSPSAQLDVNGTVGGVLVPRMTTAQRNGIFGPAVSLLIFNTSTGQHEIWNGVSWGAFIKEGGNTFAPSAPFAIGSNDVAQPASLGVPATGVQVAFVKLDPAFPSAALDVAAGGQVDIAFGAGTKTVNVGTTDAASEVSIQGGALISIGSGAGPAAASEVDVSSGTGGLTLRSNGLLTGDVGTGKATLTLDPAVNGTASLDVAAGGQVDIATVVGTKNVKMGNVSMGSIVLSGAIVPLNDVVIEASAAGGSITIDSTGNAREVTVGPAPGVTSAELSVNSTVKGFAPPRMTTAQKLAVALPDEGIMVYDLTLHKLCVYTGVIWETVTSL